MSDASYLDIPAVAARTGRAISTVRSMRSRGQLPTPDILLDGTPGWLPATIDEWAARHPPRGVPLPKPTTRRQRTSHSSEVGTPSPQSLGEE